MNPRRGIALLAALAVMALVALLVVGALASSTLAQRGSRLAHTDALLTSATDFGINTLLADPVGYDLAELPLGRARIVSVPMPGTRGVALEVAATRLRDGVLWFVATASLGGLDQGQRRFNLVARFAPVGPRPVAAVVSRGTVSIGPNVTLSIDTTPEPDCAEPPVADIVVPPGVGTTGTDSATVAHLQIAADSATYYLSGSQLTVLDGAANVRHVRGDTAIVSGSFNGILLVDGSLTIAGPFTANGLIVAAGPIDARAGGFVMSGAVMSFAAPAAGRSAIDLASASIQYSACAVARALRMAVPPRPVHQRSWAELF